MATVRNFGMLEGVDWNSFHWSNHSSEEDLANSQFQFVTEFRKTYTSLNFGHEIYPPDDKGYYHGLLPHIWSRRLNPENSKHVCVVFMKSVNYHNEKHYLIGFYAFPEFEKSRRLSPIQGDDFVFESNIKARPDHIIYLKSHLDITDHPEERKLLPPGKKQGKRGFNYLNGANVLKILDLMTGLNPDDRKLSKVKLQIIQEIQKYS